MPVANEAVDAAAVVLDLGVRGRRALERHQHRGEQDQHRDDGVEHGLRQREQQDAAEQRAGGRADGEDHRPPPQPAQLAPVADHAADPARDEPDGVGDVRDHRRVADREQRRERDQRAGADDRVHPARREPRREYGDRFPQRHCGGTCRRAMTRTSSQKIGAQTTIATTQTITASRLPANASDSVETMIVSASSPSNAHHREIAPVPHGARPARASAPRRRSPTTGDSPPTPATAPTTFATAMKTRQRDRELEPERPLVGAERLQLGADRVGALARPRVVRPGHA